MVLYLIFYFHGIVSDVTFMVLYVIFYIFYFHGIVSDIISIGILSDMLTDILLPWY